MERQAQAKLKFLLDGFLMRLESERDFFLEVAGTFRSGTKSFPLQAEPVRQASGAEDGSVETAASTESWRFRHAGRTETLAPEVVCGRILELSAGFDRLTLECRFRGETLVIEADARNAGMKTKRLEEERRESLGAASTSAVLPDRDYRIRPGRADALLKEIGVMTAQGKIRNDMIRKYNQIDHFVELLEPMLKSLPGQRGELLVVDCGCGKSYLSFVLNWYLREELKRTCRFVGLDIQQGVVDASARTAERLGYRNMQFHACDIRQVIPGDTDLIPRKPDLVISLHACDVATDYALAFGMRHEAAAIVAVPCCQSQWLGQYDYPPFRELMGYGVLKARLADVLTDGYRCMMLEAFGYEVSCIEYISPLDSPKNLMIRAERNRSRDAAKYEACRRFASGMGVVPALESELLGFF